MLPTIRRLRSSEVERVLRAGFSLSGGSVRVKALKHEVRKFSRFAVVVSKKTAGSAVERNRLRRQAFAVLRTTPLIRDSHDIVVLLGKKYDSHSQMQTDIRLALSKLVLARPRA
jgi:ribonuclease P protein component